MLLIMGYTIVTFLDKEEKAHPITPGSFLGASVTLSSIP
jgi:hypothetical protein